MTEERKQQRREAQARYRASEKGKAADERYKKSDAFKRIRVAYTKRWREKNRLKTSAHSIVNTALRAGILTKGTCEVCSSKKVVAHHDDYTQPLLVRWLCSKHHLELHCLPAYLAQKGR